MDKSRNYILDRLKSKKTSIEEFNYDALQAPPLSMFLSPYDIQELYSIATSLKYSAKPEVRYAEIDRVCRRRGLVKFAAGTNRVVYRHPEFPDYLFKIAADDVGMRDNPAEYKNQFFLKPFVAKCFEISPCGTVALVEKVNPITSREEYVSVADDVFELLNEWIIGKYVVADIGTRYFMNIGCRTGFGVVLIDYPYVYELDGNKLYCNKHDPTSKTGYCDGVIDYDDGFNTLYCTKCGAKYKAKELELKIADNELVIGKEGDIKMNIKISGGSKNVNKTISVGEENNSEYLGSMKLNVTATPSSVKTVEVAKNTAPKKINLKDLVNGNDSAVKTDEVKLNVKKVVEPKVVVEEPVKVEEVAEKVVEEVAPAKHIDLKMSVNGVSTEVKKEGRSPISFSEEAKVEAVVESQRLEVSPVEAIERAVKTIEENVEKIDIDSVKDDVLGRLFDSVVAMLGMNLNTYKLLAKNIKHVYEEADMDNDDEFVQFGNNDDLFNLYSRIYALNVEATNVVMEDEDLKLEYDVVTSINAIAEDGEVGLVEINRYPDSVNVQNAYSIIADSYADNKTDPETPEPTEEYNGVVLLEAKKININEILPLEQPKDILVITDTDGRYITDKAHSIVGVATIDNKSVESSDIVSSTWLDNLKRAADEVIDSDDEVEDNVDLVEKEPSLGALPASMEEFLNNESVESTEE